MTAGVRERAGGARGRIDQRIAERRREVREQRRRRRLRRTLTMLALLVLLSVGYAVERSSLVALSEVEVVGLERLDTGRVLTAADLPLGTSTLRLDLTGAEARVRALPMVRDVEASRVDPLTVRLTVEERRPTLVVTSGGERALVDEDGVVVARGSEDGLVTVVLPERIGLPADGVSVATQPALEAAYVIHRELPAELRQRVDRIEAHAGDDVDVHLRTGDASTVLVRFGRADRLDEKARALSAVLADVRDVPVRSIDVRAPATPVVRS